MNQTTKRIFDPGVCAKGHQEVLLIKSSPMMIQQSSSSENTSMTPTSLVLTMPSSLKQSLKPLRSSSSLIPIGDEGRLPSSFDFMSHVPSPILSHSSSHRNCKDMMTGTQKKKVKASVHQSADPFLEMKIEFKKRKHNGKLPEPLVLPTKRLKRCDAVIGIFQLGCHDPNTTLEPNQTPQESRAVMIPEEPQTFNSKEMKGQVLDNRFPSFPKLPEIDGVFRSRFGVPNPLEPPETVPEFIQFSVHREDDEVSELCIDEMEHIIQEESESVSTSSIDDDIEESMRKVLDIIPSTFLHKIPTVAASS